MLRRAFAFTIAVTLLFIAVISSAGAQPMSIESGSPFTLHAGEQAWLDAGRVRVTFDAVTEDSRCPIDVACVWSGQVVVQLSIDTLVGGDALRHDVVRLTNIGGGAEMSGYRFSIEAVQPPARRTTDPAPKSYAITFVATLLQSPGKEPAEPAPPPGKGGGQVIVN